MKKYEFQTANFKLIVFPLLIIALLAAFGCSKVDKPVRGEDGSGPMAIVIDGDPEDAPDSHKTVTSSEGRSLRAEGLFSSSLQGIDYWKAYHPTLVTGTHNPELIVVSEDEEESCLDCHDQSTSCNNCHTYVGVELITSD